MRNYKMIIAYDGSRYKGWQRQNLTNLTIQTILERTVEQIVGYPVEIDGSGRTDAGVHANGQVANMKVSGLLDESFVGRTELSFAGGYLCERNGACSWKFSQPLQCKGEKV